MWFIYLLWLCALTSALAVALGRRRGLSLSSLCDAGGRALEGLGLAVVLLLVNVGVGIVLTLGFRAVSGRFLSLYRNADLTLLVLAAVQALVLQAWWWPGERAD